MKCIKFFSIYFVLSAFISSAILPPFAFAEEGSSSEEAIVSMEFDGAALKDVLKVLSKQSGLNFATTEEVENKRITIFLDHVPAKDALESIVAANDLVYERKGENVYTIFAKPIQDVSEMQTRVIHLKYSRVSLSPLDVGGESTIKELKTPEQVGSAGQAAAASTASTDSAGSDSSSAEGEESKTKAERGIDKLVATMLSENGQIAVDMPSNSLVITDTLERLNEIERVVKLLDRPARQVMLEVQLMEVKKGILDDRGVEWGGDNGALLSMVGGERTIAFPFEERVFDNIGGKASVVTDPSELTLGTLSATNFSAVLRFLTTQTDTKILARPRVITMNNEAANIRLVTSTATARTSTLSSGGNITTLQTGGAERTSVGVILKITPQINDDNTVGLFVEPSVTTVAASTFFPADFLDPTTRSVRTMARVMNNQTLVIGGLIDNNDSRSDKKVPFLGDIPGIGNAFSYKSVIKSDSELLIFITPHIVMGFDSMAEQSATAKTQDLAAKRLVNVFKDEEYERAMTSLKLAEKENDPAFIQEKDIMITNAKNIVTPAADQAMAQAVASANPKKFQTKSVQ